MSIAVFAALFVALAAGAQAKLSYPPYAIGEAKRQRQRATRRSRRRKVRGCHGWSTLVRSAWASPPVHRCGPVFLQPIVACAACSRRRPLRRTTPPSPWALISSSAMVSLRLLCKFIHWLECRRHHMFHKSISSIHHTTVSGMTMAIGHCIPTLACLPICSRWRQ